MGNFYVSLTGQAEERSRSRTLSYLDDDFGSSLLHEAACRTRKGKTAYERRQSLLEFSLDDASVIHALASLKGYLNKCTKCYRTQNSPAAVLERSRADSKSGRRV